jgi:hypothetical protein
VAFVVHFVSDTHLHWVGVTSADETTKMFDLLRFLGGLVSAALQWLAGLTCMSPIFFFLFYESGRLSSPSAMLLGGFLLLDGVVVWFLGVVMRQIAPGLSQTEPYHYGQTTIGAILCFWGIAESTRVASMELARIYPLLSLVIPGLVLLVGGIRLLMLGYVAGE